MVNAAGAMEGAISAGRVCCEAVGVDSGHAEITLAPPPAMRREVGLRGRERDASAAREDDEIVCEDVGSHTAAEGLEGTIETTTHLEHPLQG